MEEYFLIEENRHFNRVLRHRVHQNDPFEMFSDREFLLNFRFTKQGVRDLTDILAPTLVRQNVAGKGRTPIPPLREV